MPGLLLGSGNWLLINRVKYTVYMMNATDHPKPSNTMPPIKMGVEALGGWVPSRAAARGPSTRNGYAGSNQAGMACITGSCSRSKMT